MANQPPHTKDIHSPTKRSRWATQRATSLGGRQKRHGVMNRFYKGAHTPEKKRESGGSESVDGSNPGGVQGDDNGSEGNSSEPGFGQRTVYFNVPLPASAKDEEGRPIAQFGRNKIRTAKYTPLSFVPKNLWFQFHNIANIYFFFLIILSVSTPAPQCLYPVQNKADLCRDIPNLWCGQPRSQLCTPLIHSIHHRRQGRD